MTIGWFFVNYNECVVYMRIAFDSVTLKFVNRFKTIKKQ